jgi:hypothetical protein
VNTFFERKHPHKSQTFLKKVFCFLCSQELHTSIRFDANSACSSFGLKDIFHAVNISCILFIDYPEPPPVVVVLVVLVLVVLVVGDEQPEQEASSVQACSTPPHISTVIPAGGGFS